MSSTFAAKAGSVERLKVRRRCGCRRCFCQMRWIVRSDRPIALAIARPVQWVVSPGGRRRSRHHLGHVGRRDRRFARRAGLVAQQTLDPGFGIAPLPAPHRRAADPGAPRHLDDRQPICRKQDNPAPLYMLQRPAPIAHDRGQPRAILASNDNADFLCHASTIAHLAC